jgi:Phosphate-selective porin
MKSILTVFCCLSLATVCFAQEVELTPIETLEQRTQTIDESLKVLQKLKVSGYIQTQYQWGEKDASLKVGSGNGNRDESFDRFGIRRGRIKFTYEDGIASGVFQLDFTEKGVGIKDAYLGVKDPWMGTNVLKAGVFDRTFGNEISYSSSLRESPERSTIFQTLFPEERDLGAAITLQASKTSPLNFLKLEAGLFAGNGIKQETDNRKDFIGHLSASRNIGSEAKWGLGVSYYNGGVFQGNENVYKIEGKAFVLDKNSDNKGKFAKREYIGFDGQFSVMSVLGLTKIRAEYLFGIQPATSSNSKSPNSSTAIIADTYIRNFSGGYVIFVQDLGQFPLSAVLKYDWYDPNVDVAKNDVGLNGTGSADMMQNTLGLGMLWRVNNNIRLQAYYDFNSNEKADNLAVSNIKSDVFTLRLQYKF